MFLKKQKQLLTNSYDPYAVKIMTKTGILLGYIPGIYAQVIHALLRRDVPLQLQSDTGLELTFHNFLTYHHLSVYDFYGRSGNRSFQRMLVEAEVAEGFYCPNEKENTKRLPKLFHLNSKKLLEFFLKEPAKEGFLLWKRH